MFYSYPGTDPRLLPNGQNIPSNNMTVENCIDDCKAGGYLAAGVEYGNMDKYVAFDWLTGYLVRD